VARSSVGHVARSGMGHMARSGVGHVEGFVRWTPDGAPPRRDDPVVAGMLLDRDGCLTAEAGHLVDPAALEPIPGAREAVRRLAAAGLRVAVVTNQSAVGRGLTDAAGMAAMHRRLAELFPEVEAVYHCPHTAEDGCGCRKPSPAMLRAACADLGLDPGRTWFVGDHLTDAGAARAAGLGTRLLLTGHGPAHADEAAAAGIATAVDVAAAVDELLADLGGAR
jgi:histidinol-phosphate phosphatase family protein